MFRIERKVAGAIDVQSSIYPFGLIGEANTMHAMVGCYRPSCCASEESSPCAGNEESFLKHQGRFEFVPGKLFDCPGNEAEQDRLTSEHLWLTDGLTADQPAMNHLTVAGDRAEDTIAIFIGHNDIIAPGSLAAGGMGKRQSGEIEQMRAMLTGRCTTVEISLRKTKWGADEPFQRKTCVPATCGGDTWSLGSQAGHHHAVMLKDNPHAVMCIFELSQNFSLPTGQPNAPTIDAGSIGRIGAID